MWIKLKVNEDLKTYDQEVPVILNDLNDKETTIDSIVRNVFWLMDADRKIKPLKQLQGHMWRYAYAKGIVRGQ